VAWQAGRMRCGSVAAAEREAQILYRGTEPVAAGAVLSHFLRPTSHATKRLGDVCGMGRNVCHGICMRVGRHLAPEN